jgi:hypothetical protein
LSGEDGVDFEASMLEPRTPTVESAVTLLTGEPSTDIVVDEMVSVSHNPKEDFVGESFLV